MKTLNLVLKRQWFDMISSGEKLEEYRDMSEHWYKILVNRNELRAIVKAGLVFIIQMAKYPDNPDHFWTVANERFQGCFHDYKTVTLSHGYAKNRPQVTFKFEGIEIKKGNPEWGAEPGKKYFVIKLGEKI